MAGKNTITREVRPASIFESAVNVISSAVSFDQGDLLILSSNLLAKPAAESDGSTFLGVARVSITSGVVVSPYRNDVSASQAVADIPGPWYGVVAKCQLKASASLSPGGLVYLDPATGTRGVAASGTKAIGVYQGPSVTGGPSTNLTEVEVLIGHRYPGDTLAF